MSIEHPYLRGWFPLQDGRNINVSQIIWFRAGYHLIITEDTDIRDEHYIELMLSNGERIKLTDPTDRESFTKLVGTLDEKLT